MKKIFAIIVILELLFPTLGQADEWSGKFVKFTCMPEVDYMELTTVDLWDWNALTDPGWRKKIENWQKKYHLYFVNTIDSHEPQLDFDCPIAGHNMNVHLRYGFTKNGTTQACLIIKKDKKVLTAIHAFHQDSYLRYSNMIMIDKYNLYLQAESIAPLKPYLTIDELEAKPEFPFDGEVCLRVE